MRTASERIVGAFQLIGEVFDELRRGDGVRWGDSIRDTIDAAIHTYEREVEKMDKKVGKTKMPNFNGKTEEAKPVQEENDLIEEAKRNIESCMNLLDTHACQLERAMDAIKMALMDIEDQKYELGDILTKLDNTLRKLKQGFELSGNSE